MKTAVEYQQMVSSMPVIARSAGHLPTNLNPDKPYSLRELSPEAAELLAAMKNAKEAGPRFFEIGFVDERGGFLSIRRTRLPDRTPPAPRIRPPCRTPSQTTAPSTCTKA